MPFPYLDRILLTYETSIRGVLKRFNETAVHTEVLVLSAKVT
jgi:hypothetical protein